MNYYKEAYRKSDSNYSTNYFKAYWYTSIIVILILIGIFIYLCNWELFNFYLDDEEGWLE